MSFDRLRQILQFYAESENHVEASSGVQYVSRSPVAQDKGQKAREALAVLQSMEAALYESESKDGHGKHRETAGVVRVPLRG